MKITLYEFNRLPDNEQFKITFNEGTFLDYIIQEDKKLVLYAVDLFFVEVEYNTATNKIANKTSFKTGPRLFKYSSFKDKTL